MYQRHPVAIFRELPCLDCGWIAHLSLDQLVSVKNSCGGNSPAICCCLLYAKLMLLMCCCCIHRIKFSSTCLEWSVQSEGDRCGLEGGRRVDGDFSIRIVSVGCSWVKSTGNLQQAESQLWFMT